MDGTEINQSHWDELARRHGQDGWYDVDAFLAGAYTLNEVVSGELKDAVGSVAGINLLHLQCHFGGRVACSSSSISTRS